MFLLILISIATTAMETHPLFRINRENSTGINLPNSTNEKLLMYYKTEAHPSFFIIDAVCVIAFSIELVVKIICCPSKLDFFKSFYNIIDVLCVLPFLITFILHVLDKNFWLEREFIVVIGYLSLSSVLRIFRLFKMARHYKSFRLMVLAVKCSIRELLLLILLISMGMLIFSTLIYFAEFQVEDNFSTIPIGFWWSIVTMTTVGYGDINPQSVWGYLVGGLCAVSGTLITGLPIPIIASNFNWYYHNARFITKLARKQNPSTKWLDVKETAQQNNERKDKKIKAASNNSPSTSHTHNVLLSGATNPSPRISSAPKIQSKDSQECKVQHVKVQSIEEDIVDNIYTNMAVTGSTENVNVQ